MKRADATCGIAQTVAFVQTSGDGGPGGRVCSANSNNSELCITRFV